MDQIELHNLLPALHSASFAWAMVCCRDREAAEEVLQSVYVKVLAGRALPAGRSSFRTWLFAAIKNAAYDQKRRRWWSHVVRLDFEALAELVGSTGDGHPEHGDEDELSLIRAALGKLPSRQRQIVHLVFYEDLTVGEAASVLGVTVGTASQHYARAKEALRTSLKSFGNQEHEPINR